MNEGGQPRFKIPEVAEFDPKRLYGVKSSGPQYVDYTQKQGRDDFSGVLFHTGFFWMAGLIGGSMIGGVEGWRSAVNPSFKIRMNSVLNGMSKKGNRLANMFGCTMLLYGICKGAVDVLPAYTGMDNYVRFDRDFGQPIVAGFLTGSIYMSGKGPRAAVLAGCIGGVASLVYTKGNDYLYTIKTRR